jgi:hypothetical protein
MIFLMPKRIILSELFPDVSKEQLEEITEFLSDYFAVVWRIYERLEREHPEVIDSLIKNRTMKAKVDSPKK